MDNFLKFEFSKTHTSAQQKELSVRIEHNREVCCLMLVVSNPADQYQQNGTS
jgi:hypothetical protein